MNFGKFFKSQIPRYLNVKNELFLLYLRGIRGLFEKSSQRKRSYNYYLFVFSIGTTIFSFEYFKNQLRNEFDQRELQYIYIPKFILRIRREHYLYWELSRLARGMSTTFTHYDWDPSSVLYYIIKLK